VDRSIPISPNQTWSQSQTNKTPNQTQHQARPLRNKSNRSNTQNPPHPNKIKHHNNPTKTTTYKLHPAQWHTHAIEFDMWLNPNITK
jgi:hypothetical protein